MSMQIKTEYFVHLHIHISKVQLCRHLKSNQNSILRAEHFKKLSTNYEVKFSQQCKENILL